MNYSVHNFFLKGANKSVFLHFVFIKNIKLKLINIIIHKIKKKYEKNATIFNAGGIVFAVCIERANQRDDLRYEYGNGQYVSSDEFALRVFLLSADLHT